MELSEQTMTHLNQHIDYPVAGERILSFENKMEDLPPRERELLRKYIDPDKVYHSPEEVIAYLQTREVAEESLKNNRQL